MSNQDELLCTCGCGEVKKGSKQATVKNLPGLSSLHFRIGTYAGFKAAMLSELSAKPTLEKLTSRNDDDFAVAALDAWATVLDVLSFYQERIINEGYLRTATERFSVLELAKHISYKLNPGVSSGTFLAFSMNEAQGAPSKATIPKGTKVQSIPEQDQLPQIFETTEEIETRVEWNGIKLMTKKKIIPVYGDKEIYLEGINTGLHPGDGILMIGNERKNDTKNENWDFRRLKEVIPDPVLDHTKVTWAKGLGENTFGHITYPAKENFKVYALRQRAFLFGYNAPDFRTMSETVKDAYNPDTKNKTNKNTDWKNFDIRSISYPGQNPETINTIHLDAIYSKIVKNSWLVLSTSEYEEVYNVTEAVESSRKDFTLTSKTMSVKLSGENLEEKFNIHVRDAVVFAQSEELDLAEKPVADPIKKYIEITLEKLVADLTEGKVISINGKRKRLQIAESKKYGLFTVEDNSIATRQLAPYDSFIILAQPETLSNGKTKWKLQDSGGFEGTIEVQEDEYSIVRSDETDETVREINTISSLTSGVDPTVILLEEPLINYFDPATVTINANVVKANHGETKEETLGSGDGSIAFQKFTLKQTPLTFISAATSSGTKTTLQIRVNDLLWTEVSSFLGISPKDKVYTTSIDNDEKVTVQFGDGITGARLPTGTENIKAKYRIGIGSEGLLNEGQLSMLLTPQPGVSKVSNPEATSGGTDPETLDTARLNAPLTVLTLDRIVSVKDFEDFTRAFTGIGKARADIIWDGEKQAVFITIAAEEEGEIDKESDLYLNLQSAIKNSGHSCSSIYLENYKSVSFSLSAKISVKTGYEFETVKENVLQSLKDIFSFEAMEFGKDVTPSEVIAVIQSIEGVNYTDLELLDEKDPFMQPFFRVKANVASSQDGVMTPAELLTINEDKITLAEIVS